MTGEKRASVDANILLRAVFGVSALQVIRQYAPSARFCCADNCFSEAERNVAIIAAKRSLNA